METFTFILGALCAVGGALCSFFNHIFSRTPNPTNDTVSEIQAQIGGQADCSGLSGVCGAEEMAAEADLAARMKLEEERFIASQQRAEQQHQTELSAVKHSLEETIAALRLEAETVTKAAKDGQIALKRGIQPVECPTREEYDAALKQIEYDPKKLHFAICGVSGSGKSSFVNALRGIAKSDPSAAAVGVTETTSTIGRYPDQRRGLPYSRFVWYDIPGAGTLKVRDRQYFNQQGLFVFDFIVVVYDARFTTTDVGLIENCNRFRIPVFIVRSKADQHIANMVAAEEDCEPRAPEYEEIYREKRDKFILETRSNFSEQIELMKDESRKREKMLQEPDSNYARESSIESSYQQWLEQQKVYIVSDKKLRSLLSTNGKSRDDTDYIDEVLLFEDLLKAAVVKRYSGSSTNSEEDETLLRRLAMSLPAMMFRFRSTSDIKSEEGP